jgi:hypothetical protein
MERRSAVLFCSDLVYYFLYEYSRHLPMLSLRLK